MEKGEGGFFKWLFTNVLFWILVFIWTSISFLFNPDEIELFLISPSAGILSMALNFIIIVIVVAIPFSIYYIIRSQYKLKKEIENLKSKRK